MTERRRAILRLIARLEEELGHPVGDRRAVLSAVLSAMPVVSRIAAGSPILAEENVEREVDRVRDL